MKFPRHLAALTLPPLALFLLAGCPNSSSDVDSNGEQASDGEAHAHSHSHDVPGPAGGHLLEIGDEEYHVEWVHDEDDDSIIEFIVRDELAKEEVPIDAEQLTIEFTTVDASGMESTR